MIPVSPNVNLLPKLKNGDILLCKGNNWPDRVIKAVTHSRYSHVAVLVSAKMGLVIESMPPAGVRAIHIGRINVPFDVYRVKGESHYRLSDVVGFLLKQLTNPYNYSGVFWLAMVILWDGLVRSLKRVWGRLFKRVQPVSLKQEAEGPREERDYFCSELCYEAFAAGGFDIVPQVDEAAMTSPADIAESPVLEKVPV